MKITMKEVARLAGVSVTTVSQILGERRRIICGAPLSVACL